jgi:RNA polymerase-binding transcription factor
MSDASHDERREELRRLLTERRREAETRYRQALERQLSGSEAGDSEGVHGWKASREGGAEVEILEVLDRAVRQIDEALSRLAFGAYGLCVACAEAIPLARLRAVPFATHCVPCQTRREGGSAERPAGA